MPEPGYRAVLFDCLACWYALGAGRVTPMAQRKEAFEDAHAYAEMLLAAVHEDVIRPPPPRLCLQRRSPSGASR